MSLTINQLIPELSFEVYQNDQIKKTSLSEYQGKWLILMFYPADFTFVCPTELKEAAIKYPELQHMNTELISVSTDTAYVHKAWHDTSPAIKTISYPMAADPGAKLAKSFGVYNDDEGAAWRATFIIDPTGILKAYEIHDTSIGRSISEIIRKLSAFQYVAKHHGEVCPASWTIGDKTITKSTALVGKI